MLTISYAVFSVCNEMLKNENDIILARINANEVGNEANKVSAHSLSLMNIDMT